MRKVIAGFILSLMVLFQIAGTSNGWKLQSYNEVVSFDALANSAVITLGGNYKDYAWELKWLALVGGTPEPTPVACNAACAYALYGSLDGVTWTSIKSTSATTGGVTYITGVPLNYVKFVPAITPTTTAIATVTFKAVQ